MAKKQPPTPAPDPAYVAPHCGKCEPSPPAVSKMGILMEMDPDVDGKTWWLCIPHWQGFCR